MRTIKKLSYFILCIFLCMSCAEKKETKKAASLASTYLGHWKTQGTDDKGENPEPFYITVLKNNEAFNTFGSGSIGSWKIVGERIELHWQDGWKGFIFKDCKGYQKITYSPKQSLNTAPINRFYATKVESIPEKKIETTTEKKDIPEKKIDTEEEKKTLDKN